jgi:ribosome-interacting GTPase 1
MKHITDMPGISIGGHNINNLRYPDDMILIATNEKDLQALIDRIVDKSEIVGLSLNKKKMEVMITSKKNN